MPIINWEEICRAFVPLSSSRRRLDTDCYVQLITTPIGEMLVVCSETHLHLLEFCDLSGLPEQLSRRVKNPFWDKNCGKNKTQEQLDKPSETKTALEKFEKLRQTMGVNFIFATNELCARVQALLDAYFSGQRSDFSIPCALHGSDFTVAAWRALQQIPAGKCWSYAKQAAFIGWPTAYRAVAHANSRNQIAIIIPCHRVIGSNGHLTGYAGGLARKKWLLAHEKRYF